jgi:hypothetical protein
MKLAKLKFLLQRSALTIAIILVTSCKSSVKTPPSSMQDRHRPELESLCYVGQTHREIDIDKIQSALESSDTYINKINKFKNNSLRPRCLIQLRGRFSYEIFYYSGEEGLRLSGEMKKDLINLIREKMAPGEHRG